MAKHQSFFYAKCGTRLPSAICICAVEGEYYLHPMPISGSCADGCYTGHVTNPEVLGNSVLLSAGSFSFKVRLVANSAIGAAGFGFAFGLDYLSGNAVDDGAGPTFNYPQNMYLEELPNGDVNLVTGNNLRELFEYDGGRDTYSSVNNNTAAELTRAGTGVQDQFTLRAANGTVTLFFGFDPLIDTTGRIKSFADRNGNQAAFTWTALGGYARLQTFTDSYGRIVTYSYFGSEHNYQIEEIEDFIGRKITFQYDTGNRLVAVMTPAITKGAEGNTFPNGTAYVFQYDVDNPRAERQNDLIRLWYPNEATPYIQLDADGSRSVEVDAVYVNATPRTTVEYGQDPTEEDEYAKVLRETIGSPEDGVGGTITYQYISDAAELPANRTRSSWQGPCCRRQPHGARAVAYVGLGSNARPGRPAAARPRGTRNQQAPSIYTASNARRPVWWPKNRAGQVSDRLAPPEDRYPRASAIPLVV